jgi:16S rRNA processing protein RimM
MTPVKPIKVAVITGAHGIRGEVKLRSFVENPDFFASIKNLSDSSGRKFPIKITGKLKDALIASLGLPDRNAAELMKGVELFAPESAFPEPGEGEYYHSQLIGLEVRDGQGTRIGMLETINNFGAGDIMEITTDSGESEMLPFDDDWLLEVNIEGGYVVVDRPEYI